jgi:hypothetical protein
MTGERTLRDMTPQELTAGQYMRWYVDGKWYAVPPGTSSPVELTLGTYEVEEHQDRTITVYGLIAGWHLIRGEWSEA